MPVPTLYRPLAALLIAALPCLASQCGELDEPCAPDPQGSLRLQALSRTWLPLSLPDSVRFVSSNGVRTTLRRAASPLVDSLALDARLQGFAYERLEYPDRTQCGRFFWVERQRQIYRGRNLNLTLTYDLVRDLQGAYPHFQLPYSDTELLKATADTLPDAVLVNFNGTALATFPVVRRPYRAMFPTPFSGGVRYVDTVRVAGQLLRGVYRYDAASSGQLALRHLYFQPGQGVVGFTYTNNEQWVRY
ncbi:hypothetical protein EJV47_02950 [Hymenobacter gummosus]|uniref:DUF4595 domain-containing protein n=1 Tax=Hymenobacter gummosus TaxID=1776032 RepID=A0A431U951_9BACT|nr:hypothetical protein [Hymenobacter gummosus]RTQ53709.1 hypothetical protein EJV47_02950 [Hymenobacter gummosus]